MSIIDQKNQHIVSWLSHLDFRVTQRNLSETRAEGTGEWLPDEPEFKQWLDGTHRTLWCSGDRTSRSANGVYICSILTGC